eukprot:11482327-Ditylum_brightwellii.AAC.1
MEKFRMQYKANLEDTYIAAIKEEHIGYTNRLIGDMLGHLYNTYGHISSTMLQNSSDRMRNPYNPSLPIEQLFK